MQWQMVVLLRLRWLICGHAAVCTGGFIKTIIRVLRCVGHFNSKLLVDKVNMLICRHVVLASATPQHITPHFFATICSAS